MCTRGEKVLACKFSQFDFIFIHVRPRAFSKDAHEVPQIIIFNTLQNDWSSLSFFFRIIVISIIFIQTVHVVSS